MQADQEDEELITLDQVWRSTKMLNIACPLCKRRGRYRIQGLVDRYGAYVQLRHLKKLLAHDCPRKSFGCEAHFPDAARLRREAGKALPPPHPLQDTDKDDGI